MNVIFNFCIFTGGRVEDGICREDIWWANVSTLGGSLYWGDLACFLLWPVSLCRYTCIILYCSWYRLKTSCNVLVL